MDPGLRGDDLPLDAGQELLALGQAQTQGAQIGKGVGLGDPHDIGAVFFALSSDADQPHDPGHVASTSAGIQARKYLFRSRTPNLAAVPFWPLDYRCSEACFQWRRSGLNLDRPLQGGLVRTGGEILFSGQLTTACLASA